MIVISQNYSPLSKFENLLLQTHFCIPTVIIKKRDNWVYKKTLLNKAIETKWTKLIKTLLITNKLESYNSNSDTSDTSSVTYHGFYCRKTHNLSKKINREIYKIYKWNETIVLTHMLLYHLPIPVFHPPGLSQADYSG